MENTSIPMSYMSQEDGKHRSGRRNSRPNGAHPWIVTEAVSNLNNCSSAQSLSEAEREPYR